MNSARGVTWLQPDERGKPFSEIAEDRRSWLIQTGDRLVWTVPAVREARRALYENVGRVLPDPHEHVLARVAVAMDRYINAFHLFDGNHLLQVRSTQ